MSGATRGAGRRGGRRRAPLTGAGWTVLATALALYALAAVFGYRLLAVCAVGLAVVLVLAVAWIVVGPRVDLTRGVDPDRVSVGEPALGRIDVRNRSRLPSVPFVAVDRVGPDTVELPVGVLPGGAARPVYYPIPTVRRGRVELGPLTVERRDPLGLLRAARRVAAPALLWVHPRVHPAATLPVGVVLDFEARTTANARLGTLTFSSLRDYVPGDDPRRIHWRTTARVGHLVVKEHIDTTEPTTTVLLDNVSLADGVTFEHAVEVAASVYRAVELEGRPVRVHLVHEESVPDAVDSLDLLAAVGVHRDSRSGVLERIQRLPGGGVLVVVTSGDPALLPRLADQRRRFNPVVVVQLTGDRDATPEGMHRRPGMTVISARHAQDAVTRWNHLAGGQSE
ncbi:Uncharacterized conserved protein, DUF58 family, contains vWF domain [Jatrophihabitans endophyticus]|uniref:Uncharacterized conserved protein, DUF58 family, contains vWF domain n=1 Tax=Jatrophihabitans endophyticus TaxID=1206085 RepID=A0A1M5N367_9ACTN|nr:DUF58 domain-containing protein [Jatrophihabitans endophyticus]SHG84014.1 Uncharacterized conserved protein, DUF58 family, contains vWF domain [Jatrophihabitans endophyticus]